MKIEEREEIKRIERKNDTPRKKVNSGIDLNASDREKRKLKMREGLNTKGREGIKNEVRYRRIPHFLAH